MKGTTRFTGVRECIHGLIGFATLDFSWFRPKLNRTQFREIRVDLAAQTANSICLAGIVLGSAQTARLGETYI